MASARPELGLMLYAWSDFLHPIQFCFSEEGIDRTVQNWPGSDLDGLVRVWLNASGLKARWCARIIRPGFWQDANGPLPVSHFQTRFHSSTDVPDNTVQNQSGSGLVLAVSGFGQTDPVRKQAGVQETSGPLLANASTLIRTGSSMFTGMVLLAQGASVTVCYTVSPGTWADQADCMCW